MTNNVSVENLHVSDMILSEDEQDPHRLFNIQVKVGQETIQSLDPKTNVDAENEIIEKIGFVVMEEMRKMKTFSQDNMTNKVEISIGADRVIQEHEFGWYGIKSEDVK